MYACWRALTVFAIQLNLTSDPHHTGPFIILSLYLRGTVLFKCGILRTYLLSYLFILLSYFIKRKTGIITFCHLGP